MVARTLRRQDPTPGPAQDPTPFADAALFLHDCGLVPVPLGGDGGKVTLLYWRKWKSRPPARETIQAFVDQRPTANVGVLTGLTGVNGVTVVDIDDEQLVGDMVRRYGDTLLKIQTPRGAHLWFSANGERNSDLRRSEGIAVDIRGVGGVVVVPPSVRPNGKHAGKAYTFLEGFWDDLCRLPYMAQASEVAAPPTVDSLWSVHDGARGDSLFKACLNQAPDCDTLDQLLDVARTINGSYVPPMTDTRVVSAVKSAWQIQTRQDNWRGNRSHVYVPDQLLDELLIFDKRRGPDALAVYVKLQAMHSARDRRGETFAVDGGAMAQAKVLPWNRKRIYNAIHVLVKFPLLKRVVTGGKGPGSPHQYRFCSPSPPLVPKMGTNVIKQPPPPC